MTLSYNICVMFFRIGILAVLSSIWLPSDPLFAHGSVTPDDDLCIIRIGYYRAHFKMYLPRARGHKQFCEDIPSSGETVFVMEYGHSGLASVPIDFRIIRNITGQGVFTNIEDVKKIKSLDAVTIAHHKAAIQPDVFTFIHNFKTEGEFVGIVNVNNPENGKIYTAVFPFEVGFTGISWWVWFVIITAVLQANYLWMHGSFSRWKRAWQQKKLMVVPKGTNNA